MDNYTYFVGTSVLMVICVFGAIFIPDPEQIFEIISGFTVSAIVFIFPALFFLVAQNEYGDGGKSQEYMTKGAIVMLALGVLDFFLCSSYTISRLL
jgi:hypothetical protein